MAEPEAAPGNGPGNGLVAAVDLGSNSFHLIVARPISGELHVVDRLREMVQLGTGLTARKHLTQAAQKRALACLARFGQRLRDMPPGKVRAVGTNTLRQAREADAFLARAEAALGHPIEVIGGHEEARLIYLGAAHSLPATGGRRLVIDIGGGSTELIIGEGFEPIAMDSLYLGCISATRQFFPDGALRARYFRGAETAAHQELQSIAAHYRRLGWDAASGTSGTIGTIADLVGAQAGPTTAITLDGLYRLRGQLTAAGAVRSLALPGLSRERAPVFAGGVAILIAAFEALAIARMDPADGALREGLLYDLYGRIQHEDVRSRTIAALTERFHLDLEQAARVERTAMQWLAQVPAAWSLAEAAWENLLRWAARLHEIGLAIAHNQYHKHGAYLVEHADLAGFSRQEQHQLALLVRCHRRKLAVDLFAALPKAAGERLLRLCLLLRLAVLLHRARTEQALPPIILDAGKRRLALRFPDGWLAGHPLTRADLSEEAGYLDAAGWKLRFQ